MLSLICVERKHFSNISMFYTFHVQTYTMLQGLIEQFLSSSVVPLLDKQRFYQDFQIIKWLTLNNKLALIPSTLYESL